MGRPLKQIDINFATICAQVASMTPRLVIELAAHPIPSDSIPARSDAPHATKVSTPRTL